MTNEERLSALPGALLPWYSQVKRDLPWRQDREPYHIWISEIMLQQTRVEAVKGYYARFLNALPDISSLARCDDDALHKLWEGLGYYSRVRNLKKAAQVIESRFGGQFPDTYEAVISLPGIGEYTAGAICSIAWDLPTPAVDGNVLRVYARLLSDSRNMDLPQVKKEIRRELAAIYPREAGDFTQALMELGATVCGPNRAPDCENCPCRSFCRGYADGTAQSLPIRSPKKEKRQEERTVFILRCGEHLALEKRPDQGLLASLWQFPNVKGTLTTAQTLEWAAHRGLAPRDIRMEVSREHIFTHIHWKMKGIYLEVGQMPEPYTWLTEEAVRQQAALPTAFRQFLEEKENV